MTLTATFNPCTLIPGFVRRLLLIGEYRELFEQRIRAGIQEVWTARHLPLVPDRAKEHYFDCILVTRGADLTKDFTRLLQFTHTLLNDNGIVSILFSQAATNRLSQDKIDDLLVEQGFLRYRLLSDVDAAGTASKHALVAVRHTYNPIGHARQLAGEGCFDDAIGVLEDIPDALIGDMEVLSHIAAEKQHIYLKWQQSLPADVPRNRFFFRSQRELAQVTATLPQYTPAYWDHSDFWLHIGNNRMAARTLRSILHVDANPQTQARLQNISAETTKITVAHTPPDWSGTSPLPRLLVLTHDNSDYGMDTLYDGLCGLLGPENVVEFPWKPYLHGQAEKEANNYPCVFNFESKPRSVAEIVSELKQNRFDAIIFADVVQMAYGEQVKHILEAGKHLPVVVYDSWDNAYTPLQSILAYLGRKSVDLLFKREMLQGLDYGPQAIPLPFGYPDSRIPSNSENTERKTDIFWAGKRVWGLRPLYIPRLEEYIGRNFDQIFPQDEYSARMRSARIGLSFFGSGFDTVRYWELPAHGAMLLAERPPIQIPHNFKDGETAVFFDDLPELEEKLRYYLSHPAEVERIAAAGHHHFKAHHTTACRARQFLGYLERHFGW